MVRPLLVSLAVVLSVPAAAEECVVTIGPHDRLGRGKTVVVEAGEALENVLALDGDVILRRGARVKSAVAVNGNVILEPGAGEMTVSEGFIWLNTGRTTYQDLDAGTLRFYAPPGSKGDTTVIVLEGKSCDRAGVAAMFIPASARPANTLNAVRRCGLNDMSVYLCVAAEKSQWVRG